MCAQVGVVEHLLEHEMLSGNWPHTSAQLIPDSFRLARVTSEPIFGDVSGARLPWRLFIIPE
jgi:hypothetical protein